MSFRIHSILLALALLPFALLASGTNQCVTTAMDMALSYDGAPSESWSFALTGTVTWCNGPCLVLKDETGNCILFNVKDDTLDRGERVAVSGSAHVNPSREPWIDEIAVEKLGPAQLPPPEKKALADCLNTIVPLEGVRTEGIVVDVCADEFDPNYDWLVLKDGAAMVSAACRREADNKRLIDARVEVTGPICTHVLGVRKFVSPFINTEFGGSIKVLSPPMDDPFDYPLLTPSRFASPADIERLGKHTAVGKVVATWPANNCLLLTPDRRLIRLVLAASEPLPPCDSSVRAVGYPSSDLFTVWLTRAKVRPENLPEIPPDTPETISAERLFPDGGEGKTAYGFGLDNRLIALSGLVKGLETHNDGTLRVILDCDGATVPVDFSARPEDFAAVTVGSEIKVTGRCILLNERWNPNNVFPRITGLLVVLSEKPELLHGPAWWTTGRLLTVIVLLVVALIGVFLKAALARRFARIKLNERTQLAVEIHDSLSQALTGLACQITAAQDSLEGDALTTKKKLATANKMLMSCRTELRNCLFDLRNDTLGEKNFNTAIRRTLEPLEDSATILVRFNVDRAPFEDSTVHAVLVVIRELVSNAVRHGNAWTVKVAGAIDHGSLHFSVTDDGCGFDPVHCANSDDGHFGLDGVRERLARLDGTLSFETPSSGGTRAVIRIPLPHS